MAFSCLIKEDAKLEAAEESVV
ncbi:hypothetical protein S40288_11755 [Stachybotrys chartarum IBT 40288]|nr:hypothetical protein S40288_11755 [Stachybotrys chartarum IBT 40288]